MTTSTYIARMNPVGGSNTIWQGHVEHVTDRRDAARLLAKHIAPLSDAGMYIVAQPGTYGLTGYLFEVELPSQPVLQIKGY